MALNAWTILGKLGLDTTGFTKSLNTAQAQAVAAGKGIEKDIGAPTRKAESALDQAAAAADDFVKALDPKKLKDYAQRSKDLGAEVKAGIRPLKDLKAELTEQERALQALAKSQQRNTDEYRNTVQELTRVRRELKDTNAELKDTGFSFDKFGEAAQKLGTKLTVGVTTPLTILAGVGIKSAMDLEVFQGSLEVLTGSAEKAAVVFDDLYEFSARAPFSWEALTEATRTLSAFGTEAEDTIPLLKRLGDVAAATQTPIADLADIYGRMQLTGRVTMMEITRLGQRGIPIIDELAKSLGVSAGEIQNLVTAGKIGFPEIQAAFESMTNEGGRFNGMMEVVASTTRGRLNTLRDSFSMVTDLIGERLLPAVNQVIELAQGAVDWFVELDESTQNLFVGLGVTLASAGPLMIGLGTLSRLLPVIAEGFGKVRIALSFLTGPVGLFLLAAAAVTGLMIALNGPGDSLTTALDAAKQALAGEDKDSVTAALDTVISKVDGDVRGVFKSLRDDLVETGDVGVQQMARIAKAIDLAPELIAAQKRLLEAEARLAEAQTAAQTFAATGKAVTPSGEIIFDVEREERALAERLMAMGESDVVRALRFDQRGYAGLTGAPGGVDTLALMPDVVNRLIAEHNARLQTLNTAVRDVETAVSAEQTEVNDAKTALEAIVAQINEPVTTTTTTTGKGAPTTTTGGGKSDLKTVSEIVAEVERATREALRVATFEGTQAALVDANKTAAQAANAAITTLLTDPYDGLVSDEVLNTLRKQRDEANRLVLQGGFGAIYAANAPYLEGDAARILAAAAGTPGYSMIDTSAASRAAGAAARAAQVQAFDENPGLFPLPDMPLTPYAIRRQQQEEAQRQAVQAAAEQDAEWRRQMEATEALQAELATARIIRENQNQAAIRAIMAEFNGPMDGSLYAANRDYLNDELAREINRFATFDLTTTNRDRQIRDEARAQQAAAEAEAARQSAATTATQLLLTLGQTARYGAPGALDALTRQAYIQSGIPLRPSMGGGDKSFDPYRTYQTELARRGPGSPDTIAGAKATVDDRTRDQILADEIEARQKLVTQLTTVSADDGPLEGFGKGLAGVVTKGIPLLSNAISGFVSGGPIGALVAVFTDLLGRSEAFAAILGTLNTILDPVVSMFDALFSALMPIVQVAVNLVQAALLPLTVVIEKVLAPAIAFVARIIAGAWNALASAINAVLGWAGVKLPLINLDGDDGTPQGMIEKLEQERADLLKQITTATSEDEIARLNRRLAIVDEELARLRGLGKEAPDGGEEPLQKDRDERRDEWRFTSTPQTIQWAVATPIVEAAQTFLAGAVMIRDTFNPTAASGSAMADFTTALTGATPVLRALTERGIIVDIRAARQGGRPEPAGALR